MSEQMVRDQLNAEYPLLIEMGWDPYNTESAARTVAKYAQNKIEDMQRANINGSLLFLRPILTLCKGYLEGVKKMAVEAGAFEMPALVDLLTEIDAALEHKALQHNAVPTQESLVTEK